MTTTAFRSTLPDPGPVILWARRTRSITAGREARTAGRRLNMTADRMPTTTPNETTVEIDPHMIEARQVRGAKRDQESDP